MTATLSPARPVLKWAGGKARLLEQYQPYFPSNFSAYYEPFVGGAAVFFEMVRRGMSGPARLSDINEELIGFYRVVQKQPKELLKLLSSHAQAHGVEHFYAVRAQRVDSLTAVERAARLYYLNKTCFNGLYRVNSQGDFNVPYGRYKNPGILQEERILTAHRALKGVRLEVAPFHSVNRAKAGDFVYFDPPYIPLSATSNFTTYTRESFGLSEQQELADLFARLDSKGVQVLLSNSDTELTRALYKGFTIVEVRAPRMINSVASKRQDVGEVLVIGGHVRHAKASLSSDKCQT